MVEKIRQEDIHLNAARTLVIVGVFNREFTDENIKLEDVKLYGNRVLERNVSETDNIQRIFCKKENPRTSTVKELSNTIDTEYDEMPLYATHFASA